MLHKSMLERPKITKRQFKHFSTSVDLILKAGSSIEAILIVHS